MAIIVREFSKIFRGSMPPNHLERFFFLFLNFKLIQPEKTTLEKMLIFGVPSLKQFLTTPQTWNIFKVLIYALFPV